MTVRLAPNQVSLWLADRMTTREATYNVVVAYRLRGAVDLDRLARRFDDAVRACALLRARVEEIDGVLVFSDALAPTLAIEDVPLAADDDRARRRLRVEARRPFSLTRGPLARALLLRYACGEADLVFSAHHLVVDERSIELLIRWVITGEVAAPRSVFGDWADKVWASVDDDAMSAENLREDLAKADLDIDLQWGLGDAACDPSQGARVPFELSAATWRACRALARDLGTTTNSLLVAAVGLVVAHNARSSRPVVATSVSRRPISHAETIGYFNSTVLTPVDAAAPVTISRFLRDVHGCLMRSYRHGNVPLTTLLDGTLGRSVVPQVVVVPCAELPTLEDAGVVAVPHADIDLETAQFAMGIYTYDRGDKPLTGFVQFQRRKFAPEVVQVFARQMETTLTAFCDAPDALIADVATLHPDDAEAAIRDAASLPLLEPSGSIPARICQHARQRPHAVAVVAEDRMLTYAELERRSARLARALREAGIGEEDRIGVCLPRGAGLVVALLGVLRAGAAYVPLDPDYPPGRLAFMTADAGLKAVVAPVGEMRFAPDVCIVSPDAEPEDETTPLPEVSSAQAAYVIYTSGSTGEPKGAIIEHRNVLSLMDAVGEFGLGPDDVWSFFHSFAFDFSVWEIWGCLVTGGRLVVVPFWTSRDPRDFHMLLAREGVTVLSQTPSAFVQLVTEDRMAARMLQVRLAIFGGEALDPEILRSWFDRYPETRCRAVNMYGITETTVHCTLRTMRRSDVVRGTRSVGRPLPGWRLYVLDERGQPTPPGVPGEIYVAGSGVARGYLNRPELTAQRFLEFPLPYGRLYRSGDVGRRLANGEFEHLGRADDQVKILGHRIELGEVRTALLQSQHVRAAAAVAVAPEGDPGAARLEAYVVLDLGGSTAAIRQRLRETLPHYMLPAMITAVPDLPLNANGKLDVARLRRATEEGRAAVMPPTPSPGADHPPQVAVPTASVPDSELTMARTWSRVLGVHVDPDDNFFELGGNSLLAVRLHHELRELGCRNVRLADIFRHSTPHRLYEVLRAGGAS